MLNLQSIKKLVKALKVVNQRIAQLRKTFGKSSSIYQEAVSKFETTDLDPYVHYSKSGDLAFSYGKIAKMLQSDSSGDYMKVLERVLNVAGLKEGKSGYLRKTDAGIQVQTVKEIRREWRKILDPDYKMKNGQLDELIDASIQYKNENLSEIYYEFRTRFGTDVADARYQELLGRDTSGKLSESESFEIKAGLIRDLGIQNLSGRKEQERRIFGYSSKSLTRMFGRKGFENE